MNETAPSCPIAIVGMACRYPDADDVAQLFENSLAQRQAFRKIPDVRLAAAEYCDESGSSPDSAYVHQAAVLEGFEFDRSWFRVSRQSYEVTDPSHWLALTVAREAIESIRFRKHGHHLGRDGVRVVVGNTLTGEFARANLMRLRWPYVRGVVARHLLQENPGLGEAERARWLSELEAVYKRPFPVPNEDFLAGGLANTIAGRICNHFDFKGGGYTVDGACSSSLLAVTDACSALAAGDADLVLAGGVDLSLDPFELVGFSRSAALARHEMRVYDEQSEGFWPGEGCGFVALMRHADAVEQCEEIHALIHGWGISSDGRGGLTRPEPEGQILALQRCYRRAGYGVETVGYFEGHGTGTKVGDAAELTALIRARRGAGLPIRRAVISSIKANIGHTKAAAGLAGMLRAAMCVRHQLLPPTTACRRPHPLFAGQEDNLAPSDRVRGWDSPGAPRRAGVSAMGFGGINAHVTLAEAPQTARRSAWALDADGRWPFDTCQDAELFLFAASRREDLLWTVEHLAGFAEACSRSELTDLAAELAHRATRGAWSPWKAAIVAGKPPELRHRLELLKRAVASLDEDGVHLDFPEGIFASAGDARGRIGFLFPGQGSPARPRGGAYARRFREVRRIYRQAGLEEFAERGDTDFAQPAIAAASLAGLEVLKRIGVEGDLAIGHSLGEVVALHWAGCFDEAALLALARTRGRAMAEPAAAGAMAAIKADARQTAAAIRGLDVHLANHNAPRQTVVSGGQAAIEKLVGDLRRRGLQATLLPVRRAFHSPLMAGAAASFRSRLQQLRFEAAQRVVISTVDGAPLPATADLAAHLGGQLVSPVLFQAAVERGAREVDLFVEVGPGDLLTHLVQGFCGTPAVALDAGGEAVAPLLRAAGAAHVLGKAPGIKALFEDRFSRRFDWSWSPSFLGNPCQSHPVFPQAAGPSPAEPSVDPLVEPSVGLPQRGPAAGPATGQPGSTGELLRGIVADRTGLPAWTLQDTSRMMSDLHFNSITVGEIVAQAAAHLGLLRPIEPTQYADASLGQIALALDQLRESGAADRAAGSGPPGGVGSWVRSFAITNGPARPLARRSDLEPGSWEGFGAVGEPEGRLVRQLREGRHGPGVFFRWPGRPAAAAIPALLQAALRCVARRAAGEQPLFVVIQPGWGGGGFARSFFLEQGIPTLVLNLEPERDLDVEEVAREIDGARPGFSEIFLGAAGRQEPRWRLVGGAAPAAPWGGREDVILVTGGGRGISAECAFQLARRGDSALLVLGRSRPEENAELGANLERFRRAGLRVSYQPADVTDRLAVAAAVAAGVAQLGAPVTGIVHGAGRNQPCAVAGLEAAAVAATVAPKVAGLENLLAALDPGRLTLLVTFGSIISRLGLHGEADYALANEWLSQATAEFQADHPACRCRALEWSVWSGTGMGQRLGRIEALIQQGISPISVDEGVRELLQLVDTPDLPTRLVVSGRFGQPPTWVPDDLPSRPFRFLEEIVLHYAGTELIAEWQLSPATDPYLDDHVLDGERLFPAVMALEAMAEAAAALLEPHAPTGRAAAFRQVVFRQAVIIPAEGQRLRLVALAEPDGEVAVAIRCAATRYQINHVEARLRLEPGAGAGSEPPAEAVARLPPSPRILPFDPELALYRDVLFQNGRFKRISGYREIAARRCSCLLAPGPSTRWFERGLPQHCLLGDPGARDAALHAIQACIPDRTVVPISVAAIESGVLAATGPHTTLASEVEDRGEELVYDLSIFDQQGRLVERWRQLALRVVGEPRTLPFQAPPVLGSFFERRLAAILPDAQCRVSLLPSVRRRARSVDPEHRPDGQRDPQGERFRSAAYGGGWQLAVSSVSPVGCDLQNVLRKDAGGWAQLLGEDGLELAEAIARVVGEPRDSAATRVWAAREALKKSGFAWPPPLVVDPGSTACWTTLCAADATVFSSCTEAAAGAASLCAAVAFRHPRHAGGGRPRPAPLRSFSVVFGQVDQAVADGETGEVRIVP